MDFEEERLAFEREKWIKESEQRDRELDLRAAMQRLETQAQARSRLLNPLVLAIFAAAIAALSNAYVARQNGKAQIALEDRKSEQARILQMISAPTPDAVRTNLEFLLSAGLVSDPRIASDLKNFLEGSPDAGLPALRVSNATASVLLGKSAGLIASMLGLGAVGVDLTSEFIRIIPPEGGALIDGCTSVLGCTTSIRTDDFLAADYDGKLQMISQIAAQLRAQ